MLIGSFLDCMYKILQVGNKKILRLSLLKKEFYH